MANCNCPSAGTPFNARSARSGVVVHDRADSGIVILITAPAAKKWRAAIGNDSGWRIGNFDSTYMGSYHLADGAVTYDLPEPDKADFDAAIPDPAKADMAFHAAMEQWAIAVATSGNPPTFTATATAAAPKATTGYTPRAKKATPSSSVFTADPPVKDRYWYESEQDTNNIDNFIALRRAGHDTNAIILGPSGFGKTDTVIRLAERKEVPVHIVNCQVITTPEKWLGQMQVDPVKGTYFDVSQHLQWVERSHPDCQGAPYCIMLYDEITRLRPELGNMLFSLLDMQQGLEVPQMGRRVDMADENVVFATANIGSAYSGTFLLDWALRGRFDTTLERPFPPKDEEIKVLMSASPKLTEEDAKQMVDVAEHTRILWRNGEIESPISTRLLMSWARYVAGGQNLKTAAESTVIPVYNEDGGADSDRAKVKMALDGKVA